MLAERDIVARRRSAVLEDEDEDELVLAAVEGTHAGIVFGPDTQVLLFGINALRGGNELAGVAPIHSYVMQRALLAVSGKETASLRQERREGPLVHLARGHGELAMMDGAETAGMAVNRHVVGRVGEAPRGPLAAHQRHIRTLLDRAAAVDAMRPQSPEIARAAYRQTGLWSGHFIVVVWLRGDPLDQQIDIGNVEPGHI